MGAFSDFTAYAKQTGSRLSDQPLLFETTRRLDATQHELFNYVTDFDRSSEWIRGQEELDGQQRTPNRRARSGAVRVIKSAAGEPGSRVVKAYEAPRMLAYSANDGAFLGLCTDHLGVMTCEPHPDGGTVVCWLAYGRLASNPPKPGRAKSCSKSRSAEV